MSIQQLKELFGNQEAVLELKAILGEQTPIVAQHMIQAALFGLLEKQVNEWQAEVVDEQPKFLS